MQQYSYSNRHPKKLIEFFFENSKTASQRLSYLLKENWMITRDDNDFNLYAQHQVVDFIISKINEKKHIDLYTRFFFKIASGLLNTTLYENVSSGNQIKMYTINISLTNDLKRLRQKIWEFSWSLYPNEKNAFHKLLYNSGNTSYRKANDILAFDYELLSTYLRKLDYTEYRACEATALFLKKLTWNNIEYDKSIEEIATNKLFELNKLLTEREDWREEQSIKRKELFDYFKDYKYEDYIRLFEDVEILKSLDTEKHNNYTFPLSIIISNIATKDNNLFIEVLIYHVEHYSTELWCNEILDSYFKSKPTNNDKLFNYLSKSDNERANTWLLGYHYAIPKDYLSKTDNKLLLSLYKTLLNAKLTISAIDKLVEKYQIYEPKNIICNKILGILGDNPLLYMGREGSLIYLLDETGDYSSCQTVYIKNKNHDKYFDWNQELLLRLIEQDSNFFIKYLDSQYDESKTRYDYTSENFHKLWQLDNYKELILIGINYFKAKNMGLFSRDIPTIFFRQSGDYNNRAISFIEEMINDYYTDIDYMEIIFNIISHSFTQYRNQFLKQLLQLTQNYETFKAIVLFPRSMTATGSWIPIYERRMKDCEGILEAVKSLEMGIKLIKHIKDIEDEISSCKKRIKYEAKRDFMRQFDF